MAINASTESAPRIPLAKYHTPYIVENQWYSRLFTQSMAAKVEDTAVSARPAAAHLREESVHFGSPSASCEKELRRNTAARPIQMPKYATARTVKKPRLRNPDFLP